MAATTTSVTLGVLLALLWGVLAPASATSGRAAEAPADGLEGAGTEVVLVLGTARSGESVPVRVRASSDGSALVGVAVHLERSSGTGWQPLGSPLTDSNGEAGTWATLERDPARNRFRARAGDSAWSEASASVRPWASRIALTVPGQVTDEKTATIRVRWSTEAGEGVAAPLVLQRRVKKNGRWSGWTDFRTLRTDADGAASTVVTPRHHHRWRATGTEQNWVSASTSLVVLSRNLPAGTVVKFSKKAPKPRIKLGAQKRAVGQGANVVVRRIPDSVWRSMKGVSWRKGCPVGRGDLRLVETNYWAFDGYRRRGRVVVARTVVPNFRGAFTGLYTARVPIRSLHLPDRFGRSKRLGGADDLRSMAAGNSSAFNCRGVVGQAHRRSPHSWGRSFDLNPWENPFRSAQGVVPNRWWASRAHPDVAWRSSQHRVVKILARNGFRWTYGHGDLHHFDAVPGAAARQSSREMAQERSLHAAQLACAGTACD